MLRGQGPRALTELWGQRPRAVMEQLGTRAAWQAGAAEHEGRAAGRSSAAGWSGPGE